MNQPESTGADSRGIQTPKAPAPAVDSLDSRQVASASASSSDIDPLGGGRVEPPGSSSLAPVWSRYIDSRLKQFCTR